MKQKRDSSWYIIANPVAAHGSLANNLGKIKSFLKSHAISFELVETKHPNHAIDLVTVGVEKGFRKIIAIGGDGTNNEVINGIMMQAIIPSSEITYCLLSVGTGKRLDQRTPNSNRSKSLDQKCSKQSDAYYRMLV